MKWLEKLGLVEGSENAPVENKPDPAKPLKTQMVEAPAPVAQTQALAIPSSSEFDKQFEEIFEAANNNTPDYYSFIRMKSAMANIPLEDVRYQTSFNVWKVSSANLSKAVLLATANKYKEVLTNEISQFQAAMQQQTQVLVVNNRAAVEVKQKELAELSQKVQALSAEIQTMSDDAYKAERKIKTATEDFDISVQKQLRNIDTEVANIERYIQ